MSKKQYVAPSLVAIGCVNTLTGMHKAGDYLDNSNGSDAWKYVTEA